METQESVVMETRGSDAVKPTASTYPEDSFMLESDPDVDMPAMVTLATPESQLEEEVDSQLSSIQHDHTYSIMGSGDLKEGVVNKVTTDFPSGMEGMMTTHPLVTDSPGSASSVGGVVEKLPSHMDSEGVVEKLPSGVESHEGVLEKLLSQELFSQDVDTISTVSESEHSQHEIIGECVQRESSASECETISSREDIKMAINNSHSGESKEVESVGDPTPQLNASHRSLEPEWKGNKSSLELESGAVVQKSAVEQRTESDVESEKLVDRVEVEGCKKNSEVSSERNIATSKKHTSSVVLAPHPTANHAPSDTVTEDIIATLHYYGQYVKTHGLTPREFHHVSKELISVLGIMSDSQGKLYS